MYKFCLALLFALQLAAESWSQGVGPVELKMEPLPQIPIVPRVLTDLADEGLNGRVKMVVIERSDASPQSVSGQRQMSHLMLFNMGGYFVQRDYYDYRGNPFQITQYGYVDGKRVSKSRNISYPYDPPPMAAAPSATPVVRDTRYEYSHEFDYVDGKLIEKRLFSNSGRLLSREVYNYSPNQIERLVYSSDGRLNQKYLMLVDRKGNIIEQTDFGLQNRDIYGDRNYRSSYEFDSSGNWTKKTTSRAVTENGATRWLPFSIHYRTISYY